MKFEWIFQFSFFWIVNCDSELSFDSLLKEWKTRKKQIELSVLEFN